MSIGSNSSELHFGTLAPVLRFDFAGRLMPIAVARRLVANLFLSILLENWRPFRSWFGGVGHVEVNQVVENLHIGHLNPCLRLDEVFDFVDSIIHGDGDSFVAFGDFHGWPFSGAAGMPWAASSCSMAVMVSFVR